MFIFQFSLGYLLTTAHNTSIKIILPSIKLWHILELYWENRKFTCACLFWGEIRDHKPIFNYKTFHILIVSPFSLSNYVKRQGNHVQIISLFIQFVLRTKHRNLIKKIQQFSQRASTKLGKLIFFLSQQFCSF